MIKCFINFLGFIFFCVLTSSTSAFDLFDSDSITTTEILSDQGIVCDQEGKLCKAEGNIQVKRGNGMMTCEKLIAHFSKDAAGKQKLQMLEAFGKVHIFSPEEGYDATSTYCRYEVNLQLLTLSGSPVIKHKNLEIYGTHTIIYNQLQNIAIAPERATIKKEDKLMQGNVVTAYFETTQKDKSRKTTFHHILAEGNVIVSTPEEIARGNHGSYYENNQVAELWEQVVITRCDGQILGERARINMESGQSQMLQEAPHKPGEGRAQALLLPKQKQL